ncbi:MAG: NAD-dependent epimerase/dehydratase family protein [Hyphomicrobiales bacterium]|nr:NAD-dependent epimerase/dehydratase family protein [Hyphomicrobiales bacterium]
MRVLVTGGKGFLGAWIIRRLSARGFDVRVLDRVDDRGLVGVIAGGEAASRVDWRCGDIASTETTLAAADGCDAIVHLAGVLTPDCAADPVRGAQINLIGTLNVFEAARAHRVDRLIYASSAGVFGPHDGATPSPHSHYGAFKLACEGSARAYFNDHRLSSVGFRPYIVYGPGRETGLTAGPTLACRAAARGEDYTIGYSGRAGLVFVDDVAAAYEAALLRAPDGAHVFNINGASATNDDVISAIRRIVPDARLACRGPALSTPEALADDNLGAVLPGLPRTKLADGVERTIDFYRRDF